MGRGKTIDQNAFEKIKILQELALSNSMISKIIGVSTSTVSRVKASPDYSSYRKYISDTFNSSVPKKIVQGQEFEYPIVSAEAKRDPIESTNFVVSNYQMNRLIEATKENNALLSSICKHLSGLLEELTGKPAGK